MSDRVVRIACGQGFWGDRPEAPLEQVTRGPVDYVVMDYLAEVTMSILQKARSRDPGQGYARDFIPVLRDILPVCAERGIRVVSNAGGVNLAACRDAALDAARSLGLTGQVKVGTVHGDDILERLPALIAAGHELRSMDSGAPLREVVDRVVSANVYIGAAPLVALLQRGATVVIAGRSTDTALTLRADGARVRLEPRRLGSPGVRCGGGAPDRMRRAGLRRQHDGGLGRACPTSRTSVTRSSRRGPTVRSS